MEEEYLRKQQQQDEKYLDTFQEGPAFISQPAGDMLKINEIDNKEVSSTNSIPADPRCRFQWALMPIILWMKLWGMRLDSDKSIGGFGRAVFFSVGFLGLAANSFINGFSLYSVLNLLVNDTARDKANISGLPKTISSPQKINIGMEQSFNVSLMLGDHIIFFVITLTTWKKLWAHIIQIQDQMNLPPIFYRRCLIASFVALIILVLDGLCYGYLSLYSFYWKIDPIQPLAIALGNLSHLSAMSVLAVICVIVTAVTSVIGVLNQRMEVLTSPNYPSERLAVELEQWRLHHDLVCRVVEQMNWCFGLVLLLTISTGFVFFISISYQLIFAIFDKKYDAQVTYGISLLQLCWRLFIVIVVAYRLQAKAMLLIRTLRRMRSTFHHQILLILNTVIVQVSQANTKLSAMDFFDVNLTLFPTLIGTTLTYLVIMCQS